jgi:hypothetical protein
VRDDVADDPVRPATPDVSAAQASLQLARILESPTFQNAPMLSRLLRHLVEATLEGTAERLKEYAVGVDVFDRPQSFDPRTDTIVRVQARRLRAKLTEYYARHGQYDPVVIDVPTGHYKVAFRAGGLTQAFPDTSVAFQTIDDRPLGVPLDSGLRRGTRLPAARTSLVGREEELEQIKRLLRDHAVRLVTLPVPEVAARAASLFSWREI